MEKAKVAVFIGSASDEATVAPCADILKKLGIPFRFTVTSAHRTPERTAELVDSLEAAGCEAEADTRATYEVLAWPPISPARLPPAP